MADDSLMIGFEIRGLRSSEKIPVIAYKTHNSQLTTHHYLYKANGLDKISRPGTWIGAECDHPPIIIYV